MQEPVKLFLANFRTVVKKTFGEFEIFRFFSVNSRKMAKKWKKIPNFQNHKIEKKKTTDPKPKKEHIW